MMICLSILFGLAVIVFSFLAYRRLYQSKILKRSHSATSPKGISSVESITIGGINQSILIQTQDLTKPVLLILHGGPAMPAPGVGFRSVDYAYATTTSELMKHYVLIFWDQRGTGKSFHTDISEQSMNIEQFISDANELVDYLRDRFQTEKIYLGALSWGSVVGLNLVARYPEKFHAYAGMAQIVNWSESDKLCYEWNLNRAKETNNQKAIRELTNAGAPPYHEVEKWLVLRKWNLLQGAMVYEDENIKAPVFKHYIRTVLTSPDYTLSDVIRTFSKIKASYPQQMIDDFSKIDFLTTVPKLDVPVYFFHGRHDKNISGVLTEHYYNRLMAPKGKHFVWLENSSHMFYPEDARIVEKQLIGLTH
jgi:pimeloyl-ACP methyl ester carboxylesterase